MSRLFPSSVHRRRGVERCKVLSACCPVAHSRQIPTCWTFQLQQAPFVGASVRRPMRPRLDLRLPSILSHLFAQRPRPSAAAEWRGDGEQLDFSFFGFILAAVVVFLFGREEEEVLGCSAVTSHFNAPFGVCLYVCGECACTRECTVCVCVCVCVCVYKGLTAQV